MGSAAVDAEALREAVRALQDRGIPNASDLVRAGAAAMVRRALAAYDERPDAGPGWLAQVVRSGGPWARPAHHVETADEFLARRGAA